MYIQHIHNQFVFTLYAFFEILHILHKHTHQTFLQRNVYGSKSTDLP